MAPIKNVSLHFLVKIFVCFIDKKGHNRVEIFSLDLM